jgi:hypothetical protein
MYAIEMCNLYNLYICSHCFIFYAQCVVVFKVLEFRNWYNLQMYLRRHWHG